MTVKSFIILLTLSLIISLSAFAADPILDPIGPQSTVEGVRLTFNVTGRDPDSPPDPPPSLFAYPLPGTAKFVDSGNGIATFDWTPLFIDAGTYSVTFYAKDGTGTDSEVVVITVQEAGNQPPTLDSIGPKSTPVGNTIVFNVTSSDPDSTDPVLLAYSLPGDANFVDYGNGSGRFTWTPALSDTGTYFVTFVADDGSLSDSELVTIEVFYSDPGVPDTLSLVLEVDTAALTATAKLYIFNDEEIVSASAGFTWDNPVYQMDSGVVEPFVGDAFEIGPYVYINDTVSETNAAQRFRIGGSDVVSPGIPANSSGRRLWATYFFSIDTTGGHSGDTVTFDTVTFIPGGQLLFVAVGQLQFPLIWTGPVSYVLPQDVHTIQTDLLPQTFTLKQNYPNPFNPTTNIEFEVPALAHVSLTIYNLLGQTVKTLVDNELSAGKYVADWDGTSEQGSTVASGIYFYRLQTENFVATKKMMLIK